MEKSNTGSLREIDLSVNVNEYLSHVPMNI